MSHRLNALVAERVCGATWSPEPNWPGGPVDILRLPNRTLAERRHSDGRVLLFGGGPAYSTDMNAALEALKEAGLQLGVTGSHDIGWLVMVWRDGVFLSQSDNEHSSLPTALCLALLRAAGVDEDEIAAALEDSDG